MNDGSSRVGAIVRITLPDTDQRRVQRQRLVLLGAADDSPHRLFDSRVYSV